MSKEEIKLEESYLLLDFFDNVKRVLTYLHTDEVEFEVRPRRKANFLKYRFSYLNEDGQHFEELITHCLKLGGTTLSKEELEKFNKVVAVIEKENVSLKPINKETTIEEFLKQFSKFHEVAYLNRQLNKELPTNDSSDSNTKRLKL
jgi:tRNA isopentenyl-2-thiomethyl-A-37 hydroxylase MiaE